VPKVVVNKNESVDKALRRLKKKIDKEGIMKQIKQHRHYEKPSQKRRRKEKDARKKMEKVARMAS
jgi:small subunit ribosomal protein S21